MSGPEDESETDDDGLGGFDYRPASSIDAVTWQIDVDSLGLRLDQFLARCMPEQSRARIQKWIAEGAVTVDPPLGRLKPSSLLKSCGEVGVQIPAEVEAGEWVAEPVAFQLVYEDEDILVISKPAGLVVHPAAGHASGTLLNGLLHRFPALRSLPRAGIVHRLDRDTTGLMVVAKTHEAQTSLVRQLQARTVSRQYLAVLWSAKLRGSQTIEAPIGRDPNDRQKMAVVGQGRGAGQALSYGKEAITHLRVLGHGSLLERPVSLVECRLETGRTHQIRVHVQHVQAPMVGDPVYSKGAPAGAKSLTFRRQALHAASLALEHPRTGQPMRWSAPPPSDFIGLCAQAGLLLPPAASTEGFWPPGVQAFFVPREHETPPLAPLAQPCKANQVHGIEVAADHDFRDLAAGQMPTADAIVLGTPGMSLQIRTADCLPVLASWSSGTALAGNPEVGDVELLVEVLGVGGAHAGWRGLAGGVLEAMLNRLTVLATNTPRVTQASPGVAGGELRIWLGPCIGPESFEIGAEVRDAFLQAADRRGVPRAAIESCFVGTAGASHTGAEPKYHADLQQIAWLWIQAWRHTQPSVAGLALLADGRCTLRNRGELLSYRGGDSTERMRSIIGFVALGEGPMGNAQSRRKLVKG